VEADDDGLYVLKFRGAGQGVKALIAELLAGEIGRALGLPVPEIVFVELDPLMGRTEPDPEIQDLLKASAGLNLALDYLPGSVTFEPLILRPEATLASEVVWFDAYTTNVDRTPRNTNILVWHRKLWLIDHGAALYFHHAWDSDYMKRSRSPFAQIREHVLLPFADALEEADARLSRLLTPELIRGIVELIPDEWLCGEQHFADAAQHRAAYVEYLLGRLEAPRSFALEASRARAL
ncbi:MAG: aminotransferase class I and II, partial [Acidobacteria bacterium]|nr:aminotransferase class I and II [Acidobacteriota bacterium]